MTDPHHDPYAQMTVPEVANAFRVSQGTILRWAKSGVIPAKRSPGGRTWLFSRRLIEDILSTEAPDARS